MPEKIEMPHSCPNCNKTASTTKELLDMFGFRQISPNTIRTQSWCTKCRGSKKPKNENVKKPDKS